MIVLSGCVQDNGNALQASLSEDTGQGVCNTLRPFVAAHTDALVVDGGDTSLETGVRLVGAYDVRCDRYLPK